MPTLAQDGSGNLLEPLKNLALTGVISPAALAAAVDNYSPTDLATANVLRLDPGGASRNITGIAAQAHGKLLLICNIATANEDLVLKHQDASSSAANRIIGANVADVTIREGGSALLWYDATSGRWRVVAI